MSEKMDYEKPAVNELELASYDPMVASVNPEDFCDAGPSG